MQYQVVWFKSLCQGSVNYGPKVAHHVVLYGQQAENGFYIFKWLNYFLNVSYLTQIYQPTVLQVRSLIGLKSRCWQDCVPFWRLQGSILFLSLSSFQRPSAFLGLWSSSSIFKASNSEWITVFALLHGDLLFCFPLLLLKILVIILVYSNNPG